MRTYSPDLRQKIVDAVRRGLTKTEVARTFSVSRSSVKRYVKIDNELGSLVPSKLIGSAPKIDDTAKRLLESDLEERPAATLAQRRAYLLEITGLRVGISTLWRALKRLGYSHKKRSVVAAVRKFRRVPTNCPRGAGRGIGSSNLGSNGSRRSWLFQALWLPVARNEDRQGIICNKRWCRHRQCTEQLDRRDPGACAS